MKKSPHLKNYLNYGEVVSSYKADDYLKENRLKVQYCDVVTESIPIVPFQVFALTYENDIVIETNHPVITMHEFAQIDFNGETIWIAKNSVTDGTQTLSVPERSLLMLAPEIDIPRRYTQFLVQDDSNADSIDIKLKYKNHLNEFTEVSFHSDKFSEKDEQYKRNGSTFNHSQKSVSALLDISHKKLNVTASVSYNGINYGIRKILGIIPVKALLRQTQAGFATGEFIQKKLNNQIQIKRQNGIKEDWSYQKNILSYKNELSKFEYHYNDDKELTGVRVISKKTEVFSLVLSAPLPDFQRRFSGEVIRNFIVKVNGLHQGIGMIKAKWNDNYCEIHILPTRPFWFKARPVLIKVQQEVHSIVIRSCI